VLGVNSTRSGYAVNGTVEWTQPVACANVIGLASPLLSSRPRPTLFTHHTQVKRNAYLRRHGQRRVLRLLPQRVRHAAQLAARQGRLPPARGLQVRTGTEHAHRCSLWCPSIWLCVSHQLALLTVASLRCPTAPLSIFPQLPRRLLRRRHRPPAAQRRHGGVFQGTCRVSHTHGGARLAAL